MCPSFSQGAAATDGLTWKDIGFWWGKCQKRGERSKKRNGNIDSRHRMVFPSLRSTPVFLAIRAAQPSGNMEDDAELCSPSWLALIDPGLKPQSDVSVAQVWCDAV